jgi:D-sedoheptulose 7-phosphate isomerase
VPDPALTGHPLPDDAAEERERAVRLELDEHLAVAAATRERLVPVIAELAGDLVDALAGGGKLLVFGNGGSAADAQHMAAELTGHFAMERGPLPAIALTTDTSVLTAIANDYEYGEVFARQVRALGRRGDLVIGISTSGRAESVVRAVAAANALGARTWALTGRDGGTLAREARRSIIVPSVSTARIQEMHVAILHAVCARVDDWVAEGGAPPG